MLKKRFLMLLLCLMTLLSCHALADIEWDQLPDEIRPGKSVKLSFTTDGETASVSLEGYGVIRSSIPVTNGSASIWWDGCVGGVPVESGVYALTVSSDEMTDMAEITIGEEAPVIDMIQWIEDYSTGWTAEISLNMPGTLRILGLKDGETTVLNELEAEAGDMLVTAAMVEKNGALAPGEWSIELLLVDETGFSSGAELIDIEVKAPELAHDAEYHKPNERSIAVCDHEPCFWKMNMGEMDEEVIWQVLTQPVTVLEGSEREQVKVRARPEKNCTDYVGEVTCMSQAVHVLGQEGDWTHVELYSSGEEGSKVAVYAELIDGWVQTKLLKEKPVSQKYGIVIDKLQQRLYLFKEGKLYSTLLCSTGFPRDDTPFNETPAGEFIIVSWTGGFWSGNLYCDLALRINDGILLHEVPCTITKYEDGTETRDYSRCERYLGEKASHGCIRVQKLFTPEGINMKWMWEHLNKKENTKVIIWDEVDRTLAYPSSNVTLYYNPAGGKMYHSSAKCRGVKEMFWPLAPFTYGELDSEEFAELTPCPSCAPQLRHEGIDQINKKNTRKVRR